MCKTYYWITVFESSDCDLFNRFVIVGAIDWTNPLSDIFQVPVFRPRVKAMHRQGQQVLAIIVQGQVYHSQRSSVATLWQKKVHTGVLVMFFLQVPAINKLFCIYINFKFYV